MRPPQLVARGAMGEIFRVDVPNGTFALKRLFEWNPGTGAEAEAAFTTRARAAGVTTPVELRTVETGDLLAQVAGDRFRAYTWLDLHDQLKPPVPSELLVELGRVVGALHATTAPTTHPIEEWYLQPPDGDQWRQLAATATAAHVEWSERLEAALPLLVAESQWAALAPRLPPSVCHRDLDPSNVLLQRGGGLAVLDWENLGPLAPEHDLGMALLSFVAVDSADVRRQVRDVRSGYVAAGGTVCELSETSFAVVLTARLNFVHLQARVALDPDTTDEHRRFAASVVRALLARPTSRGVLPELVAGWAD